MLFGIGTDYILYLLLGYRERLRLGEDRRQAMVSSVARVGQLISSAAGVKLVGEGRLGLEDAAAAASSLFLEGAKAAPAAGSGA